MSQLLEAGHPDAVGHLEQGVEAPTGSVLAEHTGQPLDRISRDADRDFVMRAEEALAFGIADHAMDPVPRPGLRLERSEATAEEIDGERHDHARPSRAPRVGGRGAPMPAEPAGETDETGVLVRAFGSNRVTWRPRSCVCEICARTPPTS